MFAFAGDTVLDPFLGSGTTSLAAKKLLRDSVGYEVNPDFFPIIKDKLLAKKNPEKSSDEATFEFIKQEMLKVTFQNEIQNLPYIFRDPHKFDKKIDPKKLQFGSKIDKYGSKREKYYSVKEIISPELIKLNNDLIVRLIGVKQIPEINAQAINYLANKTNGQKIFLKYDYQKYDNQSNLLCYLYLQNNTFINAHLIKEGQVSVDREMNFKYKDKFIKLENIETY